MRRSLALLAALLLCISSGSVYAQSNNRPKTHDRSAAPINGYQPTWWKEAVAYQIYPRSFQDSNDDGIGDLNGITQRLDYLQKLGVNVIWLSPHFDSPNADNGYDIRDYRKVMAEFGTMEDFDRMLAAMKARHMRLIIDLVANHSSDEHFWFQESRKSKDNPYRDYYIWRDGKPNPADPAHPLPPNNYRSAFSGSAWQWDDTTQQFYLHSFAIKQPDLNWENPKVREEVYSLMRFWLDKGVDGFRMDVITRISKEPGLPDTPELKPGAPRTMKLGPRLHEFLQEMGHEVLSKYDVMTVGEAGGVELADQHLLIDSGRHELGTIFNFDAIRLARKTSNVQRTWTLTELKAVYDKHATELNKTNWDTVFLSNHDSPRLASAFGDTSSDELRIRSAKLLETMILTLRGTPYIFEGDELGMTNFPFISINQFDDIEAKNAYKERVLSGKVKEEDFLAELRAFSRDNARTPMQWNAKANAGFAPETAKTWLPVNPNFAEINADAEDRDPNSVLNYTRQVIALRHPNLSFVYGDYNDLAPQDAKVFAYTRTLAQPGKPAQRFLIVLNFDKTAATFTLPAGVTASKLMLANIPGTTEKAVKTLHLAPWEARIYSY